MQARFRDAYVSSVVGKPRFVPFPGRAVAVHIKRTSER